MAICCVCALLLASQRADALSIRETPVDEMTTRATVIVIGTVQGQVSQQEKDQFGRPRQVTTWTLLPTEVLKGKPTVGAPFTWRQVGKSYEVGKEYLLFLLHLPKFDLWTPVGTFQGRFQITTNTDGSKSVTNGVTTFSVEDAGQAKGAAAGRARRRVVPLSRLRDLIQQRLGKE